MEPVYTRDQVRSLVAQGRLEISNLQSRRISQTQVIVERPNKEPVDIISAPQSYREDEIIHLLLSYFCSSDYVSRLGPGEKKRRNLAAMAFFKFLDQLGQDSSSNETIGPAPICFRSWLEYLKKTEQPYIVWDRMNRLRKSLNFAITATYGGISARPQNIIAALKSLDRNIPPMPPSVKSPPLGLYLGIPDTKFTNQELFSGLRLGCLWLLARIQSYREQFLSLPAVIETLDRSRGKSEQEFREAFQGFTLVSSSGEPRPSRKVDRNTLRSLSPVVWQLLIDDPLLREWQFYSFPKLKKSLFSENRQKASLFTSDQQKIFLDRFINDDGSVRARPKGYGTSDLEWRPFKPYTGSPARFSIVEPCFWGSDWLIHAELERLLMAWLLATERAQRSGIARLTLDAFSISDNKPRTIQISTLKLRRSSNTLARPGGEDVESNIYKHYEPPFKAYYDWLKVERRAKGEIKNYNLNNKAICNSKAAESGKMIDHNQTIIPRSILLLELIGLTGSKWNQEFLNDFPKAQRECLAFIEIINNRLQYKLNNPKKSVHLPLGPIGQSFIVEKELGNNYDTRYSDVESETAGQSVATGRNTYKDGFHAIGVSDIVEPVRAFARRVGTGKIELAEKMAARLRAAERKVSEDELKELSGIKTSSQNQEDLISLLDEQDKIEISGEISLNGELLIVQTKLTAALMYGYIQHLKTHLPLIMQSPREQGSIKHLAKLLYLDQVFCGFPAHLQAEGRELAETYAFPYPPIN